MIWAKAAVVGGLLVVFAAFAAGTENRLSAPVMGQTQDCGAAISASWLVSGTPDQAWDQDAATAGDEQRAAAACGHVIHESRVVILTTMGMGGLLAIVGWTASRTRGDAKPTKMTPIHA